MSLWTRLTSFLFEQRGNDGEPGDDRDVRMETSERVDVRPATPLSYGPDSIQGEALLRDLPNERRIEGLDDIPCEGSALLQRLTEAAYPPLPRSFPALTVSQTLDLYGAYVHRTAEELPLKTADFNALALPVIRKAICYMHLLPAAKDYHHKGMGGLLAHSFEVGILAARAATEHVFDRSETPRLLYHNRPRWIFAAWLAGFLHDAGKPVTDISVTSGGEVWYPYTESLVDWLQMNNREGYFVSWKNGRVHNEHRPAVLSILPRIVSTELIDWFRSYGSERIWKSCELAVSGVGGPEDLSLIANLVMRADEESTERDRKSRENLDERKLMVEAQPARRLLTAVKTLITGGTWTVNRPGSRLWVTNLGVFIVWNDVTAEEIWRCAVNNLGFRDLPRRAQNMVTLLDAAKCIRPAPEEVSSVQDRYWPVQFAAIPTKAFRCIGLVQADLIFEHGLMPPPSIPAKVVGLNASFEEDFAWKEFVSSHASAQEEMADRIPAANYSKDREDKEKASKTARRDIPFVRDLGTAGGDPGIAVDFSAGVDNTDTDDSDVPHVLNGPDALLFSPCTPSDKDGETARSEADESVGLTVENVENVATGGRHETNGLMAKIVEEASLRLCGAEESGEQLRPELSALLPPDQNVEYIENDENKAPAPSVRNEYAQSTPLSQPSQSSTNSVDVPVAVPAADKSDEADKADKAAGTEAELELLALLYPQEEIRNEVLNERLDPQEPVSDAYPSDRNSEGSARSIFEFDSELNPDPASDAGDEIDDVDIGAAGTELPSVCGEPVGHEEQETCGGDFRDAPADTGTLNADTDDDDEDVNLPALSSPDGMHWPEETGVSNPESNADGITGSAMESLQLLQFPSPSPKASPEVSADAPSDEDNDRMHWMEMYGEDALLDPEKNEAAARFFTESVKRAQRRDDRGEDSFAENSGRVGATEVPVFVEHAPSSDPFESPPLPAENPTLKADRTAESCRSAATESAASLFDGNKSNRDLREEPVSDNEENLDVPAANVSNASENPTPVFPGTAAVVGAVTRSTESTGEDAEGIHDSSRLSSRRSARSIPLSPDADSLMPPSDVSDALAGINLPVSHAEIAGTKRAATRGARSADPAEGLIAEIRSNLETRSGPLWSEPVEDSPEGVFISPEKFFERAKELGLTKARVVQAVNSLWQPEDRILAFKIVKSTGKNVRLIGLQKRR